MNESLYKTTSIENNLPERKVTTQHNRKITKILLHVACTCGCVSCVAHNRRAQIECATDTRTHVHAPCKNQKTSVHKAPLTALTHSLAGFILFVSCIQMCMHFLLKITEKLNQMGDVMAKIVHEYKIIKSKCVQNLLENCILCVQCAMCTCVCLLKFQTLSLHILSSIDIHQRSCASFLFLRFFCSLFSRIVIALKCRAFARHGFHDIN